MTNDNTNLIYEDINKESYNKDILDRITLFRDIVKPFVKEGVTIDLCCGNGEIGKLFNANVYYDYFINDNIKKCDLLSFGNKVDVKGDNIIFTHALEHFADVKKTLDIIRQEFIKENGRLLIACPNADYDNNHKPFDRELGHYSFHNVQSIKNIAPHCGFKVIFISEINQYTGFEELVAVLEAV